MQAFIYCRVSSEEQANDNHYSLENQETRGRGKCSLFMGTTVQPSMLRYHTSSVSSYTYENALTFSHATDTLSVPPDLER